jgi:hypothetical protein
VRGILDLLSTQKFLFISRVSVLGLYAVNALFPLIVRKNSQYHSDRTHLISFGWSNQRLPPPSFFQCLTFYKTFNPTKSVSEVIAVAAKNFKQNGSQIKLTARITEFTALRDLIHILNQRPNRSTTPAHTPYMT